MKNTSELNIVLEHLAEVQEGLEKQILLLGEIELSFDLSNIQLVEAVLNTTIRNMTSLQKDMQRYLKNMDELLIIE